MLVAMAILGGCINDDSPEGCGDSRHITGEVPVRFTLKLDGFGGSRASGGVWNTQHPTVIGSRFDSSIDRLHVMIIGNDGELAHVELRQFMYESEEKGYTFSGNIDFGDEGWEAGTYRVMLLANCGPAIMSATNISDLQSTIDNVMWYSPNGSPRNGTLIPMWGMTTHEFSFTGKKDTPEEIGSIDLLRAVAKVEIDLDATKMAGYELVSAKISKANAYINPFPTGWSDASVTIDNNKPQGLPFNPIKTEVAGYSFKPGDYIDEPKGSIVFYLPEYDSADGNEATIDVTLRHTATGQTFTYTEALHFDDKLINSNNVNTGTPASGDRLATDIVRNHLYRFTIEGINFGTLTYSVKCWDYIPSQIGWNVEFSFDSEDSDARYGYITSPCFSNSENKELKESSSQFTYYFTLKGPEGATWKAFLLNPDGSDHLLNPDGIDKPFYPDNFQKKDKPYFRFAPGLDQDSLKRASTTGIAREESYKIAIDVAENKKLSPWTNVNDKLKETKTDEPIEINDNGKIWRDAGMVPTVYLVIKVALDGEHYTEELHINPEFKPNKSYKTQFFKYKFAGTESRIELRQLFIPKFDVEMAKIYLGIDGTLQNDLPEEYKENVWWNKPQSSVTQ